jgi:hypothetical protein
MIVPVGMKNSQAILSVMGREFFTVSYTSALSEKSPCPDA